MLGKNVVLVYNARGQSYIKCLDQIYDEIQEVAQLTERRMNWEAKGGYVKQYLVVDHWLEVHRTVFEPMTLRGDL